MRPGYRQTYPCGCEARLGIESISLAQCRVHAEAHRLLAVLQRAAKLVPTGTNLARDVEDVLVEAGARCPNDADTRRAISFDPDGPVKVAVACGCRFSSKHGRPSVCTRPGGHAGGHMGNPIDGSCSLCGVGAMAAQLRIEISRCGCPVPAECPRCRERERLILSAGPWVTLEEATTVVGTVRARPDAARGGEPLCQNCNHLVRHHDSDWGSAPADGVAVVGVSCDIEGCMCEVFVCANCNAPAGTHRDYCPAIPLEGRVLPLAPAGAR